jgi:hypothetical protein
LTPRTLTEPLTSRTMWRKLLQRVHPSHGGDASLYAWTRSLFEYIIGDAPEDVRTGYQRREPPRHPSSGERVSFSATAEFTNLTARAGAIAEHVDEPYARLLRMLASCYPAGVDDVTGSRAQHVGASYKQLAYIAHLSGMSGAQRTRWYRISEEIPLSQRHAGHLIKELQAQPGRAT